MLSYIVVTVFSFWLGYKFNKALTLMRDARQITFIERTVEKILSRDKITLVQNKNDVDDELAYKEFLKFRQKEAL